ncbi:TenA family protein [Pseudonocardia acaciae]|uniref:TenA family protein n=1 Tax=Pseudonocardia acaciae TaxID=551276 RepID=UPI00048BCBA7|nr:TenA family protein [Pseudonocardia acaciae]
MSRSRRLLDTRAAALEQALDMRFVREVTAGTISDQAYADYLRAEEAFVLTAARMHGLAVWDAPDWAAARHNGRAVHALVTEQADYFAAARASWPVPARPSVEDRDPLSAFALPTARAGGYPAIMTMLFAAETLYLTWCTRAHHSGSVPPGPIGDWVALHAAEPFRAGVAALADQVDRIPPAIPDDTLGDWFAGMLAAEIEFHDAIFR